MGKNDTQTVKILIDADVLIHLFKAERISLLNRLFPKRVFMLDVVLSELKENRTIRSNIESILLFSGIQEIQFPTTSNPKLFQEFIALKKNIKGDGESACLVYTAGTIRISSPAAIPKILNLTAISMASPTSLPWTSFVSLRQKDY